MSGGSGKKVIAIIAASVIGGGVLGFFVRPLLVTESEVYGLRSQLADMETKQGASRRRADEAEAERDHAAKLKADLEAKLKEAQVAEKTLSDKASEVDKKKAELENVEKKLKAAVDRSISAISIEGDDVHLAIVDRALFKPGGDELSDTGKRILDKLAAALKELSDKQVAVQGHTDEQPPAAPRVAVAPPPPPKGAKPGTKPATPPPPPAARPSTSWELSAGRALAVVHYLQDTSKIDGSRMSALAFGPFKPLSKTNRAVNRRIELVLSPKKKS